MLQRREFLKYLAGSALAVSLPVAGVAQTGDVAVADAIKKAGQLRMLSQRCAKAWLMSALGVMPDKASRWLVESTVRFERYMSELEGLGSSSELGLLVRLGADWRSYKAVLVRKPAAEAAAELFARCDAMLISADMATRAYQKLSGARFGWLINLSGRQSMLSQRAANFVYFSALGVEKNASADGLVQARHEFAEGVAELKTAPENTRRITSELMLAEQQWMLFEGALNDVSSPRALGDIATTSELMLQQLTTLDELYAALPVRAAATLAD